MRLIALKNHYYPPSTERLAGKEYEATEGDAVVLVAAKLSTPTEPRGTWGCPVGEPGEPGPSGLVSSPSYETKEQEATPTKEGKPVRKKRQYRRKDMNPA